MCVCVCVPLALQPFPDDSPTFVSKDELADCAWQPSGGLGASWQALMRTRGAQISWPTPRPSTCRPTPKLVNVLLSTAGCAQTVLLAECRCSKCSSIPTRASGPCPRFVPVGGLLGLARDLRGPRNNRFMPTAAWPGARLQHDRGVDLQRACGSDRPRSNALGTHVQRPGAIRRRDIPQLGRHGPCVLVSLLGPTMR